MADVVRTIMLHLDGSGLIVAKCKETRRIGRLDDNQSIVFNFERPDTDGYGEYDLAVFITNQTAMWRNNLGKSNALRIDRPLTQNAVLEMMVSFYGPNEFKRSSNTLIFSLGDIMEGTGSPPEPRPDYWHAVSHNAWWGEPEDMGDYYSIKNDAGDEITRLAKGGGGGSDVAWLPTVDADGNISWRRSSTDMPPEERNIKGPKGDDGRAGTDGVDGTDGTDGKDGREIEVQVADGHIQWKYMGDSAWTNLVALALLTGPAGDNGKDGEDGDAGEDGREVLLRMQDDHVQWQYAGDAEWENLIPLELITGPAGKDGTSLQILDSYDTLEQLRGEHPVGNPGDGYMVAGDLYMWSAELNDWKYSGKIQGPKGADGREILLRVTSEYIQWQYSGDSAWTNLVALVDITGPEGDKGDTGDSGEKGNDGREIQLQAGDTFIQWRYADESAWMNLVAIADLLGPEGPDGTTYTPAVSAAGVMSWTNDGGKPNPESVDLVAAVMAALPVDTTLAARLNGGA